MSGKHIMRNCEISYEQLPGGGCAITNIEPLTDTLDLRVPASLGGDTVLFIEFNALSANRILRSIVLPSGMRAISDYNFANCSSLRSVRIPASVCDIGREVFFGCDSLQEIIVEEENPCFASVDGVLYDAELSRLIACPAAKRSLTVPAGVSVIGSRAFRYCTELETLSLPEGLTHISSMAFCESSLSALELPSSLTHIGSHAFCRCTQLTAIHIPEGVCIGAAAFKDCCSLRDVYLPASVTEIAPDAFDASPFLTIHTAPGSYAAGYAAAKQLSTSADQI